MILFKPIAAWDIASVWPRAEHYENRPAHLTWILPDSGISIRFVLNVFVMEVRLVYERPWKTL